MTTTIAESITSVVHAESVSSRTCRRHALRIVCAIWGHLLRITTSAAERVCIERDPFTACSMLMMTAKTIRQITRQPHVRLSLALAAALVLTGRGSGRVAVMAQRGCTSPANAVVAENCLIGDTDWDLAGGNDPTIQGFASDISVDRGQTVELKINTDAINYRLDIYRLGYYGGMDARKITSTNISLANPQ